jgi:hypothetical protein
VPRSAHNLPSLVSAAHVKQSMAGASHFRNPRAVHVTAIAVQVLISADAYADQLFAKVVTQADATKRPEDDLVVDDNLGFAKDRVISRLIEMQTREYAAAHAEAHDPALLSALREAPKERGAAKMRATG